MAVGETVQLAPRDPDPDASYSWHLKNAPVGSQLELPEDENVVSFSPDASGTYVLELDSPEGTHRLTVRVFSGELAPVGAGTGASGMSGMSGFQSGSARPVQQSGGVSGSGSGAGSGGSKEGGRPRVQLRGTVEDDTLVVRADPHPHPDSDTDRDDILVEFLVDDRDDVSQSAVEVDGWELRIPLSAVGDCVRVHGVAIADAYSVPDTVEFTREATTDGGIDE
jgi:hypothetical protein